MLEFNATFIVAMLSFALFIVIMNIIFYRPVLEIIRKRDDYLSANYQKAEEFENSAKELLENRQNEIDAKQKECREIFKSATESVQKKRTERLSQAKSEAAQKIQSKKSELNNEVQDLNNRVNRDIAGGLTSEIVAKLTAGITD